MSKPFIQILKSRGELSDAEICERAFALMTKWSMLSGAKQVSLDEVAWLGAVLFKSAQQAESLKRESVNENGSRVVTATLSSGVSVSDGAA